MIKAAKQPDRLGKVSGQILQCYLIQITDLLHKGIGTRHPNSTSKFPLGTHEIAPSKEARIPLGPSILHKHLHLMCGLSRDIILQMFGV